MIYLCIIQLSQHNTQEGIIMKTIELDDKLYNVHDNGLVLVFQRNKNNNYCWVSITNNKNRRLEYYSVLKLANNITEE